jgi:YVTN family beta-propeller protein
LVGTLAAGQDPETFDVSPDGTSLYVSNEETSEVTALELPSGRLRGRVPVGRQPEGVTVRPDGKVVFVTSEEDDVLTAIDTGSLAVLAKVPVGRRPRAMVITADSSVGFVTDELGASVTAVDPKGLRPLGAIPLHQDKRLYVTCGRGGSLAVVDVASRAQVRSIVAIGDRPWGLELAPGGDHAFTANGSSHDLSVVDLTGGKVERRITVGGLPWGVARARSL